VSRELNVNIPTCRDATQHTIWVKMLFGRTMITCSAWDEETHEVVNCSIAWQPRSA
jgi:hypothetical protein